MVLVIELETVYDYGLTAKKKIRFVDEILVKQLCLLITNSAVDVV